MSEHTYCQKCGTWIFVGHDDGVLCEGCRELLEEEEEANKPQGEGE